MSLELRNQLEASVGLKLSATLLFTYPNLAALAEYLLGKITASEEAAPKTATPSTPAQADFTPPPTLKSQAELPAELEQLSKDELFNLFDESLNESLKRTRMMRTSR
jgi:hypothetical protein